MWIKRTVTGANGSEGGLVIIDEEYKKSCRITMERCENYYAITCGVYGLMVHTTFANMNDCDEKYNSMKADLQKFIDTDTTEDEDIDFCEEFVAKYF